MTAENAQAICALQVRQDQRSFVASNARSLEEASVQTHAKPFAIQTEEELVGFVMLFDDGALPRIGIWRLMIADGSQGRGLGRAAVDAVMEYARRRSSVVEVVVGALPGAAGPAGFYERLGFVPTGEIRDGGEVRYRRPVVPTDG